MKTNVTITVDTEASVAGAFMDPDRYRPLITEPVEGVINGRSEALGFLLRTLEEYQLEATFFVETLHSRYFGDGPMGRYCEMIAAAGHDIQLHIHPLWRAFTDGARNNAPINDQSSNRSIDELIGILEEGSDILKRWGHGPPIAARTGSFSADPGTFEAMERVGIQFTSNICTGVTPPDDPALHIDNGHQEIHGIREFPVTCFHSLRPQGKFGLRPLQVTACSFQEMRHVLLLANEMNLHHVIIVTHPFEYLKTRSFDYRSIRINHLNQRRFKLLCDFLACNQKKFQVLPFGKLAEYTDAPQSQKPIRLTSPPLWTVKRFFENAANDYLL